MSLTSQWHIQVQHTLHTMSDYCYVVTGVDVYGKRFKLVYTNYIHANCINLYRGSLWEEHRATGKRKLLKRVYN